jgi:hypothetical protein
MRKQCSALLLILSGFAINQTIAQHHPSLPSGKCLLAMKAEVVRGQKITAPLVHILIVDVSTSGFMGGENLTIKTDNSKTDMTGQADLAPGGNNFKDLHFSLNGSTPIEFTSNSIGKAAAGEFRFTAKEDNGVYTDAHGTKGSFTLEPLTSTAQQPKPAGVQEKTIYNSNEEWWVVFKNWMLGL